MAHFSRIRSPGLWTALSVLTAGEMEQFDADHFASANFDAGGTWAPVAPVVIGGSGFWITSVSYVKTGASLVSEAGGNITSAGSFISTGSADFTGLSVSGTASMNGFLTMGLSSTLRIRNIAWLESNAVFTVGQGATAGNEAFLTVVNHGIVSLTSGAQWNAGLGSQVNFLQFSTATFQGTANYGSTSQTTFQDNSTTSFASLSNLSLGGPVAVFGSTAVMTFGSAAELHFNGTTKLQLLTSSQFENGASTVRTGPERLSGSDAASGKRPPTTLSGAAATLHIDGTRYDVVYTPTGITTPKTWILDAPADPTICHTLFIHRRGYVNQGDDITVYDQNTGGPLAVIPTDASNKPLTAVWWWDGTRWVPLGNMSW